MIHCTSEGRNNIAWGASDKLSVTGICKDPNVIPKEELEKDPTNPINRCIFCRDEKHCYFDGECERKEINDKS